MIVSWNWLKDYLVLDAAPEEFARRLMMAGLNHESTTAVGDDLAIDLEVTSNRPDCLGHLGIAREAAVLFGSELKLPAAAPQAGRERAEQLTQVSIECPQLCRRYIARVIRGVKVGPSPDWLQRRLATIGIRAINNVVDITNYVLMECGQPLHAFDFAKLAGKRIVVREPRPGEKLEAIDHQTYELAPGMCVICDAEKPVAIGGVMGGAGTEVGGKLSDILLEAAEFDPSSIRATARRLNLHSDSSYRFERGVDPAGVDWAGRRAAELILDLAGGDLAAGAVDVGRQPPERKPVVLRLAQLKRILGIEIDEPEVRRILTALGNKALDNKGVQHGRVEVVPPSWRADLEREIDLVEEVARIHGYDKIPEDVSVPMATSARTREDRVLADVRRVLTAGGFDEALTVSVVEEEWSTALSPWTDAEPLVCSIPVLRRADRLRRSLIPSLLNARRTNEAVANPVIELFEIAKVYLPQSQGSPSQGLPEESLMIGLTSGGDFLDVKGVVEAIVDMLKCPAELEIKPGRCELLEPGRCGWLTLAGELFGLIGEVSPEGRKRFELRGPTTVAELRLEPLLKLAQRVPRYVPTPVYPAVSRDLNLELADSVSWADLARVARGPGEKLLEQLEYRDTYRDRQRVGPGKKRILFTITLRDPESTLTSAQADTIRDRIVAACQRELGATMPVD